MIPIPQYGNLRFAKHKGGAAGGLKAHHERTKEKYTSNPDVEPSTCWQKKKGYGTGIPEHEIESIAEMLLPAIQAFFESEDGQREFAEWKTQQAAKRKEE